MVASTGKRKAEKTVDLKVYWDDLKVGWWVDMMENRSVETMG